MPELYGLRDRGCQNGGGSSVSGRYSHNGDTPFLIDIDGQQVGLPVGCKAVEVAPRMCGDFYAEVRGVGFYVSGTGESPASAMQSAIARIPSTRKAA